MQFRAESTHTAPGRRLGASAVEFAVIAPVLFTVFLGMIDFGRAIMATEMVASAAREGARTGTVAGTNNREVETAVTNSLSSAGITGTPTIKILVNGAVADVNTAGGGNEVEVRVSIPYSSVTWLPVSLFLTNANLSASVVMRHE